MSCAFEQLWSTGRTMCLLDTFSCDCAEYDAIDSANVSSACRPASWCVMAVRRVLSLSYASMGADEATGTLTTRQRFSLCHNVLNASEASLVADSDLDAVFLHTKRVPACNVRAAKLTALDLKTRGVSSAMHLREIGMDALDLTDAAFCSSCVSAFGAESTRMAFLLEPGDAVALAGSVAVFQLGVTASHLLAACAGVPTAARAVLQQLEPRGGALQGVACMLLLDAGLRAPALLELGYHKNSIISQTGADGVTLTKLGF